MSQETNVNVPWKLILTICQLTRINGTFCFCQTTSLAFQPFDIELSPVFQSSLFSLTVLNFLLQLNRSPNAKHGLKWEIIILCTLINKAFVFSELDCYDPYTQINYPIFILFNWLNRIWLQQQTEKPSNHLNQLTAVSFLSVCS